MKKFWKYLLIAFAILLLVLILSPFLFKKQIVNQIRLMANRQLNATLNFDPDISLNLLSHFPNLSVGINDLSVTGKNEFDGDTLLYVKRLQVVINLKSLFGDKPYEIRYVELQQPDVRLIVNHAGVANWDITKRSPSTEETQPSSAFHAALQQYVIRDGNLQYADSTMDLYLSMQHLDHTGKGDFTQDVFNLQTQSVLPSLTLIYGHIPYLNKVNADVQVNVQVDVPHQTYRFKQGIAKLNGLILLADGEVSLPDTNQVWMDIQFQTKQTDFKQLLSLIPAIYSKNFDQLKAAGTATIAGNIKGSYQDDRIPTFHIQMQVQNGMFQYPSLPDALQHVNLLAEVTNEDGVTDHTVINLKQLHLEMNQQPVDAHLLISYPQTRMLIDGAVHGKLDLAGISKIYPLDSQTKLKGSLDADVQLKGSLIALQRKQYDQFQAKGYIVASNVYYQSADFPQGISISTGKLNFSPREVMLSGLQAQMGRTDIQAEGYLNQFYSYLFGTRLPDGQKSQLQGNLRLQSKLIDLNELMASSSQPQPDTMSAVKAIVIPRNIDFTIAANVDRFIYSNYDLRHIQGNVVIADGKVQLNQVKANMLGGEVALSGIYNTQRPEHPETYMEISAQRLAIPQLLQTVTIAQSFLPLQKIVLGQFSGKISLSTLLTDKLMPVLSTVNSTGTLQAEDLNLLNFVPLQKISATLGLEQLIKSTWPIVKFGFHIDSGYLYVHPFQLNLDSLQMTIAGKNGLDKQIDYTVQMIVPRSKLGKANATFQQLLAKANAAAGTNLEANEKIPVNIHLTGSLLNPQLQVDFTPVTSSVKQSLATAAQQKLEEEKQKLMQNLMQKVNHQADSAQTGVASSDSTSVKQQIQQTVEKTIQKNIQKGLNQLFKKKSDTTK